VSSQIAMKSRVVTESRVVWDSHVADWIAGVTHSTTGNRVVAGCRDVMCNRVVTSNVVVIGNVSS